MRNIIVNNNGDTRASLRTEIREAYTAIQEAQEALGKLTMNGRNYQTCKDPALSLSIDVKEHRSRCKSLEEVAEYLLEIHRAIDIN